MTGRDVIRVARRRGLQMRAVSGRIQIVPRHLLTDDLRSLIRDHRSEVVRILETERSCRRCGAPYLVTPDHLSLVCPTCWRQGLSADEISLVRAGSGE